MHTFSYIPDHIDEKNLENEYLKGDAPYASTLMEHSRQACNTYTWYNQPLFYMFRSYSKEIIFWQSAIYDTQ